MVWLIYLNLILVMMLVNKIRINKKTLETNNGKEFMLPLDLTTQNVDQHDIIQEKFIDVEVNKAINPITDFEQVRLKPTKDLNSPLANIIRTINYSLYVLDENKAYTDASYEDAGFKDDDIKFRKNSFKNTFLRLNFYDSDNANTQRLMSYIVIYPIINKKFFSSNNNTSRDAFFKANGDNGWGNINPVKNINLEFTVGDSLIDNSLDGEGFFIYYYKDEINDKTPKELFMSASFNNAKTGKILRLISTDIKPKIDELNIPTNKTSLKNNVYTKYLLKKDNTGFYYSIDTNYSNNVKINADSYEVKLYQIATT